MHLSGPHHSRQQRRQEALIRVSTSLERAVGAALLAVGGIKHAGPVAAGTQRRQLQAVERHLRGAGEGRQASSQSLRMHTLVGPATVSRQHIARTSSAAAAASCASTGSRKPATLATCPPPIDLRLACSAAGAGTDSDVRRLLLLLLLVPGSCTGVLVLGAVRPDTRPALGSRANGCWPTVILRPGMCKVQDTQTAHQNTTSPAMHARASSRHSPPRGVSRCGVLSFTLATHVWRTTRGCSSCVRGGTGDQCGPTTLPGGGGTGLGAAP